MNSRTRVEPQVRVGARPGRGRAVFIHSSNEMFGADRVLLQVVESVLAETSFVPEVWLPDDVGEAPDSIAARLGELGVRTRVLALPVLRRKYLRPRYVGGLAFRVFALWARIVRVRPAVVYCATSAVLLAAPAARLAGVRNVVLHMQELWSGGEGRVLGLLALSCRWVIAISDASRGSLPEWVSSRARTIRNGVDDRADPPPPPDAANHEPLRFLVASRWNAWKGHATLLEAWDSLVVAPGHLTIVGSPPEAGTATDVPRLVAELRDPASVTIAGQVGDITPFIDRADFVLVPSDDPEPFGLVAIEAFARRRAVIGSSGGGLSEIVTDGENGLLFPNRDVARLAGILGGATREDAARLGANARQTFERQFSTERFAKQLAAFWLDIALGPVAR